MKISAFLSIILFAARVSGQVNLSSGLTACYPLNGNATEMVNALTGTLNAVTGTTDRFNNPGSALNFNGSTSSYVELPANSLLKPGALSISGWYKPTQLLNRNVPIFTKNIYPSFHTA